MLDWGKLKPYREAKSHSFEQLSYQIAKGLHGHSGRFTPIDGSGGDTGVEFYLTLQDGSEWGWQAKFFHQPSERLSVGNRKEQIKKSLITALPLAGGDVLPSPATDPLFR